MRLILVRHAQTEGNRGQVLVGRNDIAINEHGEREAEAVAKRLRDTHAELIVSSDMLRAQQTAQYIAKYQSCPLQLDARLRERDFGIHENGTLESMHEAARKQGVHPYHYQAPEGESPQQVAQRAEPVIHELYNNYKDKTVILVGHGTLIRSLLMVLLNKTVDEFDTLRHKNTGVTILDITEDGHHVLHALNDTSHLSN